ncbi:hypothetical protein P9H28_22230, partial [Paenibacillus barengoltzii]|nr:hypothetical protein [Paenibacillus barengoltzii]
EHWNEHDLEWLAIYPLQPTDFEKQHGIWPLRIGANIAKPHYHIGPRVTHYYYPEFRKCIRSMQDAKAMAT